MDEKKVREAIKHFKHLKDVLENYLKIPNVEENLGAEIIFIKKDIEVYETAIEALEKQLPMKVKIEAWCPSCCPSCGYELSEDLGDGYYKHPDFIERCPNPECAQRLEWSKLK